MKKKDIVGGKLGRMLMWPVVGSVAMSLICLVLLVADYQQMWLPMVLGIILTIVSIRFARTNNRQVMKEMQQFAVQSDKEMEISCLDLELPYAIVDGEGAFLWKNKSFEHLAGRAKTLPEMFPELDGRSYLIECTQEDVYVEGEDATFRMAAHLLNGAKTEEMIRKELHTVTEGLREEIHAVSGMVPEENSAEQEGLSKEDHAQDGKLPEERPAGNEDALAEASGHGENYSGAEPESFAGEDYAAASSVLVSALEPERYAIYLYDETDRIYCEEEMEREKMVAGLIYLDNFEEALAATDEVRRSLLIALVDRKITKYFEDLDAVVRKTEKDRYFIVMKQKYIPVLKENHFSILNDVRSTNLGNDMMLTLSIGMGMNGDGYRKNFEYARMAMDMALGRGGDQAVVKDGDRIQYFGGRSMTGDKATRVKARVKAHALRELVENKEQILVMGHKLGDIDCFGAAIGIFRAMSEMGKKTHIVINDITSSVRPFKEEFETKEYPDDMFVTGEEALTLVDENTVLVVVDVNRVSITEEERLLSMARTIVVLDHHRQASEVIDNAVLSYVEPFASSACELVAEILQYISDTSHLRVPEANALYAGIVLDTNNFTTQTGVRTFEAAAFLRRNGADVVKVRKLFRDNMTDYKAKAAAVHNAEVFCENFAISICPASESESPTIIGAQAANELLNIIGIKASIVLTEYNGKIYVSARSIDEVNVQFMMERLGGGGHLSTAGAQLSGCTIEEAKELVKETVKQMLEEGSL